MSWDKQAHLLRCDNIRPWEPPDIRPRCENTVAGPTAAVARRIAREGEGWTVGNQNYGDRCPAHRKQPRRQRAWHLPRPLPAPSSASESLVEQPESTQGDAPDV